MTATIIKFPRKPRVVKPSSRICDDLDQVFKDLDSFGKLYRNDPYADTPCDVEPCENNLRPDGTPIVRKILWEK